MASVVSGLHGQGKGQYHEFRRSYLVLPCCPNDDLYRGIRPANSQSRERICPTKDQISRPLHTTESRWARFTVVCRRPYCELTLYVHAPSPRSYFSKLVRAVHSVPLVIDFHMERLHVFAIRLQRGQCFRDGGGTESLATVIRAGT